MMEFGSRCLPALLLAFMLLMPLSVAAISDEESPLITEPNHIADLMPDANITLVVRDSVGAHLCTLRVEFTFGKAWHNSEERTGLHMGLYLQWLSAQVDAIEFDSIVFRWYATEFGFSKFDYTMDREFSLSHTTTGWGFAGIANYYLTPADMSTVEVVGGTIELVNVTFTSALGNARSGSPSRVFGCNFTKEETSWETTTFDFVGAGLVQDVDSIDYSLAGAFPLGIIAGLPSLDALGTIGTLVFIGLLLFVAGRKSARKTKHIGNRQDAGQDYSSED